jgi:hypothetical protein
VVRRSPLGTAATTDLFYQLWMIDDCDCGAIGGMKIGRVNPSTRRKPAPLPLCPPQIPHDLTRVRTRVASSIVAFGCFKYLRSTFFDLFICVVFSDAVCSSECVEMRDE